MESVFKEIQIPNQKHYGSFSLPYVLSPNPSVSNGAPSLSHFIESIKAEKPYLESLIQKAGAILLREFPVKTASDFNDVVEAFGFEEFTYRGQAPRTNVFGRVYTANESPPELEIKFHHEMAQSPDFPGKLFFFCDVEPLVQGETPIVLSHVIYERMKEKYLDFVERMEKQGIIYSKVLPDDDNPLMPIGRGWKSTFSSNDKNIAEERAAKMGIKLEWLKEGVKASAGPVPGIRYDKSRNRKIWFNSIASVHVRGQKGENEYTQGVTFGDGEPLPDEIVDDCTKILEEESVAFRWQKGDIMLIDNWAVLHARRPSCPPRRILVSLCN